MSTTESEEFLEHFGIKGMRWGVRNNNKGRGRGGPKQTKYTKHPSQLSDQQLQQRIGRLQMEKRYKDLNNERSTKGKRFVEDVALGSAKGIAMATITGVGMLGVKMLLRKKGINI